MITKIYSNTALLLSCLTMILTIAIMFEPYEDKEFKMLFSLLLTAGFFGIHRFAEWLKK